MPYAEIDEAGKTGLRVWRVGQGQHSSSATKFYRPKRTHVKSREGCLVCKARKVKCDERKPHCGECLRRGQNCTYHERGGIGNPMVFWPGPKSPHVLVQTASFYSAKDLDLLHHFVVVAIPTLIEDSPNVSIVQEIPKIAFSHAHVMHVMLALAAAHMRTISGSSLPSAEELRHWTSGVAGFRRVLSGDWDQEADAVITTSMFLSILSFLDRSPENSEAEIMNPDDSLAPPFTFFHFMTGLVPLITRASMLGTSEIWLPFFQDVDPELALLYDDRDGAEDIPPQFVTLFNITPQSTCDEHAYLRPLRRLCQMAKIPRRTENALKFMQFVQGVKPQFMQLLQCLDPLALLLFAYWLSILTSIEIWWCKDRIRTQCCRVMRYLRAHHPELMPYLAMGL